ncbi:ATP-binding cassette domain-containing protein, partial [Actinacidiphila sp. bgisy167]|uniref:ATP-binding cassette domain-containing protein n=1 Tax=Actinacidiphila sp. bgisy167 TaxID=3413797 RepID=UPI003D70C9C5
MTALKIDNLTKHYGSHIALDALSFQVDGGDIFGFVGSNGAGKTTTMRIIVGLLAADSGVV